MPAAFCGGVASRWCFLVPLPAGSSLSSASSRSFSLAHLPAGSVFPMALRTGTSARSCFRVFVCVFPMSLSSGASPCGQRLPDGARPRRISLRAASALCRAALALPLAVAPRCWFASHKALCHDAPASNKPHPAEKSTPVWLAIWHIWAGFANSQLHCATFHST